MRRLKAHRVSGDVIGDGNNNVENERISDETSPQSLLVDEGRDRVGIEGERCDGGRRAVALEWNRRHTLEGTIPAAQANPVTMPVCCLRGLDRKHA